MMTSNSEPSDGKQVLNLPYGYRFYPSNDQVIYYLKQKILGGELPADIIPTIDVYSLSPDRLPLGKFKYGVAGEWFFFTRRPVGNLSTKDGYWHPENFPIEIELDDRIIGFKHVLNFYWGISPNGTRSNWTIYEYRLDLDSLDGSRINEHIEDKVQNFVVCRVCNSEKFQFTTQEIQESCGRYLTNEMSP